MNERTGGCACGAVRFRITAALLGVGVCHCSDCQKASGGSPAYVGYAPNGALEITSGDVRIYRSKADSGEDVGRVFCPDCGSPLWSVSAGAPFTPVKLGALDDASDLKPSVHIYVASASPWHLMHEGLPRFPQMPPLP